LPYCCWPVAHPYCCSTITNKTKQSGVGLLWDKW
jgi:hypothetical protein